MKEPLVSVCVPVYGVEKYIAKCAESIFRQTYRNLEVIFVDDCTKDRSIEVLQEVISKHPERRESVRIIRHERNQGLAAARETAVAAARGKYLMHVDSDDYIDAETIEECVKAAEENDSDLVRFGMVYEFKNWSRPFVPAPIDDKREYLRRMLQRDVKVIHYVCGALYRTSLYKDNDVHCLEGIDFEEDYAVFPRLLYYANKPVVLPKPFYHYVRFNDGSYTNTYKQKHADSVRTIHQYYMDFFKDDEEYLRAVRLSSVKNQARFIRYALSYSHDKDTELNEMSLAHYDKSFNPQLTISQKIILWMSCKKMHLPLKAYILITNRLRDIILPFRKRPA